MSLLIGLSGGICVFLVVATMTGHADKLTLRLPSDRPERLSRRVWLRQAGVNVTPAQFWGVSAVAGLVALVVCWTFGGSPTVGAVPALAAFYAPRTYYGRKRTTHLRAVVEAWPQAIRDLLASIEARRSVHHAIIQLASAGPEPTRVALADYAALARLGGTRNALITIREQLADPVSDRVIEMLLVAIDQGQALTLRILRDQAKEITADLRTTADIYASQTEARVVAKAAFGLPYLGLVMLCASVPAYREFYRTPSGVVAMLVASSLSMAGMVVARRMTKEAAEPRVIGGEESHVRAA